MQQDDMNLGATVGEEQRGERVEGRTVNSKGQLKLKGEAAATGSQKIKMKKAVTEEGVPSCQEWRRTGGQTN